MIQKKSTLIKGNKLLYIFVAFVLAVTVVFCGSDRAIAANAPLIASQGAKEQMGAWYTVPLPPKPEQMQGVHTALLPNGKVLIVNGSSNRNRIENGKILDGVDVTDPKVLDNTSIFDPSLSDPDRKLVSNLEPDYTSNPFVKIASPPATRNGESNDPFCSGHLHLPDGNVLFISGSRFYYPGEKFRGSKQTNLFNWQTNEWTTAGNLQEGRWYPSLIPLADGKIAIFSGLSYDTFNTTPIVEFYDPYSTNPDLTWQSVDLTDIENSPWNTRMNKESSVPDVIDLYPRIFPIPDGRLLITGDGAGKDPLPLHKSQHSYFMSIAQDEAGTISVSFEVGPDRQARSRVYGTALDDPNSEDILLIGGIIGTNDINFGRLGKENIPGASIVSSLERWKAPKNASDPQNGTWEIVDKFLDTPRAMNAAVILPDKEVLTINGGQFGETKPVFYPLLMTPDSSAPGGYKTTKMNPAKLPRMYHNGAVLLPDARVLTIGGNVSRAARNVADGKVRVDVEPDPTGYYRFANTSDPNYIPAEIWQAEIFSPPYLFKAGSRPEIVSTSFGEKLTYGESAKIVVNNYTAQEYLTPEDQNTQVPSVVLIKLASFTHAWDNGQRLADLVTETPKPLESSQGEISFKAPTNANLYPPGYYMMFYVNEIGKPSHAKMVQLVKG